jgi:hypothetical protein
MEISRKKNTFNINFSIKVPRWNTNSFRVFITGTSRTSVALNYWKKLFCVQTENRCKLLGLVDFCRASRRRRRRQKQRAAPRADRSGGGGATTFVSHFFLFTSSLSLRIFPSFALTFTLLI